MSDSAKFPPPKIEGGIDAVILGATPDGLAAAALLAGAGLHVVLIETSDTKAKEKKEFAPGYFAEFGDPLAATLDPHVIDALDLYRHGLSYSARRLETLARFHDGSHFTVPGDPGLIGEQALALSEVDGERFAKFFDQERRAARAAADWFAGGDAPKGHGADNDALSASVDGMIAGRFVDTRLEDYIRAEAALGAAARPSEPYTYYSFIRRLAGETAGLQGGVGAIEGGGRGLSNTLRRACQSASVSIRQTDRIKAVIIEWDRVAGVAFDDGAQIRAPVIISALPARETFIDLAGRTRLDIEFTRALDVDAPKIASIRAHIAINGEAPAAHFAGDFARRFLSAPSEIEIERAWRAARRGEAPQTTLAELVFPSVFDATLAPAGCMTAALNIHPVADLDIADEAWRAKLDAAARRIFEQMAGAAEIAAIDFEDPVAAAPPVAASFERRERLTGASRLEGYFFCGPEALVGGGVSLSAGRRAADRARAYFRKGV